MTDTTLSTIRYCAQSLCALPDNDHRAARLVGVIDGMLFRAYHMWRARGGRVVLRAALHDLKETVWSARLSDSLDTNGRLIAAQVGEALAEAFPELVAGEAPF
jgi:hypothetical protein